MSQYDPNKSYSWKPEDKFTITGKEFGLMLQASKAILNTEEAGKILLFQRVNASLEAILAKAVESGEVGETVKEEASTPE